MTDDVQRLCRHMKPLPSCLLCTIEEVTTGHKPETPFTRAGSVFGIPIVTDTRMPHDVIVIQGCPKTVEAVYKDGEPDPMLLEQLRASIFEKPGKLAWNHGPEAPPLKPESMGTVLGKEVVLVPTLPPYQRHSEESLDAAIEIEPKTGSLRAKVLAFITRYGDHGATDDEIQVGLDMNPSTERPRRIELVRAGLITVSGEARKTRGGRYAVVWIKSRTENS